MLDAPTPGAGATGGAAAGAAGAAAGPVGADAVEELLAAEIMGGGGRAGGCGLAP